MNNNKRHLKYKYILFNIVISWLATVEVINFVLILNFY
jgi:hypothetical protein